MAGHPDRTASVAFARPPRTPPPLFAATEVAVDAPPQPPEPARYPILTRLLPVALTAVTIPLMGIVHRSDAMGSTNTVLAIVPLLMIAVASVVASVVSGWSSRRSGDLDADRDEYLGYLRGLRDSISDNAMAQRLSLLWDHPDPDALWTLTGSPRMWERRPDDPDFGSVRAGVGSVRSATELVPPQRARTDRVDPVTDTALSVLLNAYRTIDDVPVAVALFDATVVRLDGEPGCLRGLLRSMICQLAVLHGPDLLKIATVVDDGRSSYWEWMKWLPHHQYPSLSDALGAARMVYPSPAAAEAALGGQSADRTSAHLVVVVDGGFVDGAEQLLTGREGVTVVQVGAAPGGSPAAGAPRLWVTGTTLTATWRDGRELVARPDWMSSVDALVCARRLAGYRVAGPIASARPDRPPWPDLLGIADVTQFDPNSVWAEVGGRDRLRVPVGTTESGEVVYLDVKEAAEGGTGPHGLCIGATGSGKSELLRTIVLGLLARHSPETLNLVLVDFKGGATFLGLERAPHVAAVITNLADEAPLVDRMRDALTGEMNRRQELLRDAGNSVSATAYEKARREGAPLAALPALFVVVDEFSELLSQQPDFADMFVAIGRLGRSLGIHLLLASQRLDEGRLRGLESHLSYRICLKTLSANESRTVLGTADAYELSNTPGLGYLRTAPGELVCFQGAFVSGVCPDVGSASSSDEPATVRIFTAKPVGRATVTGPAPVAAESRRTVLQAVLDRLAGHGPPARQVWLPPLDASPTLACLIDGEPSATGLVVPVGIVDRPFEQRRTPFIVDLRGAAGNVAVVGAPQSGKSTALVTLVTALSATNDPSRVQLYCLDFGGGLLTSLRSLPQVGSVAGRTQPDLVRRMVSQLESIIARREASFRDHGVGSMGRYRQLLERRDPICADDRFGDVFLVIDGWAELCRQFDALGASIAGLAGRGLSFGVHVVLSASRWAEIRPALRDQIGTRIELRLGDAADSELDRRQAQLVPRGRPGRGLTDGGLQTLVALPLSDEECRPMHPGVEAPPVRLLPELVRRCELVDAAAHRVLLGINECEPEVVTIDFTQQSHLLILGDNECGKTSVLRTLCCELARTSTPEQAKLTVIDYRRTLLGDVEPGYLDCYAISAAAVADLLPQLLDRLTQRMPGPSLTAQQLRLRSWWSGPDIYLLVDDYDLVATAAGNPLTPLLEYLPYAADLGLHLIVARRVGGAARAVYEPFLAALRDLGCMGLMMSGSPGDGALIGSVRPGPLPAGRGTLVTRAGGEQLIQVAWSPPG